jgi:hypothetical protein
MKRWKYGGRRRIPQLALAFAIVVCCLFVVSAGPARAQTADQIDALQQQIKALQQQIDALKAAQAEQAAKAAQPAPAPAAAAAPVPPGQLPSEVGPGRTMFANTAVKVTLGGFIEAASIYRDKNAGADVNSSWGLSSGGFPYPNSPDDHMNEFRETARQSRLSILAEGQEDYASLAAYFEMDFLGGGTGTSGNSKESNSYSPRIRHLYLTYDTKGEYSGWHFLAGQEWSLLTMNKTGIIPREENIPLTIDAQYVPGFTWTRNPQLRIVKDFDGIVWAGLSAESPQAIITTGGLSAPSKTAAQYGSFSNYTYGLLNPNSAVYDVNGTTNSNEPSSLSLDQYPDIIGKVAVDPGFGHYEMYGIARFFTDRTYLAGARGNNTTVGSGVGAAMLLPVAPKLLDFQASFLAGQGIGRYGSAQFSDVVINPITGKLDPISEAEILLGLVAHTTDRLDIYGYAGSERESGKDVYLYKGTTAGFGAAAFGASPLLTIEGSTASTSNLQASGVEQATIGFWYNFYQGKFGRMRFGMSEAYTRLSIFNMPNQTMNTVMASFRYYPF